MRALSEFLLEMNPEDDRGANNCEAFYISNDESKEDFKDFYQDMTDEASFWSTLKYNDPRITDLKNALNLETLPQVLVMDKNFNIVTTEGADDLLNLDADSCRTQWISMLTRQLAMQGNDDEE